MMESIATNRGRWLLREVVSVWASAVLCGSLGPIGWAGAASAQDAAAKEDAAESSAPAPRVGPTIEEVVVTAQKREELLEDIPIAITAFTADDLATQRVTNVMDLLNQVPSLNLAPFAGTRNAPNLFIRGMGNLNAQSTNDMATGIYLDGVPIGRPIGLAVDLADLERVEVLRGPQGTLYGRNTTAGAINFITRRPDDQLAGGVQLTRGSFGLLSGKAKVNVPLMENLFLRVVYGRTTNDGWVENHSNRPNQINFNEDKKKEAWKAALRIQPLENLTIDYSYDESEMVFGNQFYQIVAGPNAVSGRQEDATPTRGQTPSDTEVSGHTLTAEWDLGPVLVRSITAYRDLDSYVDMNFIDVFTQDRRMEQDQWSQEIQLVGGALDGRINYVAGVFYFDEETEESLSSSFAGGAVVDYWVVDGENRSGAVYGQFTWTPPILEDRFDLTLGVRHTEDSREAVKTYVNPGFTPAITGTVVRGNARFDSFNPSVMLEYKITDDINGYAKLATGYRAGGFNPQSTVAFFGPGFSEERVTSYEVGLKSILFDRRLRLDVALFKNRYKDLQVDQARVPPAFVDTLNAGSVDIKGAEIEGRAALTEGLSLRFFYSYLDAEYNSYVDGGVDYAAQRRVPNSPDWQVGAGVEYQRPIEGIGDLILNVDFRAQDDFYAGPKLDTFSKGYSVWDARLKLANIPTGMRGSVDVALWIENMFDKKYRLSTTNLGQISAQFGRPRVVGVDLTYEF